LEDYPFREAKGPVTVAVNAFVSEKQLEGVLSGSDDFLRNNVLPVQILIRNDGQDEQLFRTASLRLVWIDGSLRAPLTTAETYEAVKSSMVGGIIAMGSIGAAVVSKQNENKMKDLATVSLKDANISPQATLVGFAFFPIQSNDTSLKDTKVRVLLQNPTSLIETTFEIALAGDLPKFRGAVPPKP
jgi:hypothetical protein